MQQRRQEEQQEQGRHTFCVPRWHARDRRGSHLQQIIIVLASASVRYLPHPRRSASPLQPCQHDFSCPLRLQRSRQQVRGWSMHSAVCFL